MPVPHVSLTLQMLDWIAQRPRSRDQVLETWKSTCPRMTIWEDACADGLVASEAGRAGVVSLTERGRAYLRNGGR
jgi:hypothetical protein